MYKTCALGLDLSQVSRIQQTSALEYPYMANPHRGDYVTENNIGIADDCPFFPDSLTSQEWLKKPNLPTNMICTNHGDLTNLVLRGLFRIFQGDRF